jgi:hypothetical protein
MSADIETQVYPFCYKIKEDCPPCSTPLKCDNENQNECLELLAKYMSYSEVNSNPQLKDNTLMKLGDCLKKYGDIYKKLNIELYVNPKTKQINFPDHQRIQSNMNLFLKEIGMNESKSPKEENKRVEKMQLYNILLNDKLREVYNEFYYSYGFSDLDSIMPKEYGIARIMAPDSQTNGGKRKRVSRRKKNMTKKRKTRMRRNKRHYK